MHSQDQCPENLPALGAVHPSCLSGFGNSDLFSYENADTGARIGTVPAMPRHKRHISPSTRHRDHLERSTSVLISRLHKMSWKTLLYWAARINIVISVILSSWSAPSVLTPAIKSHRAICHRIYIYPYSWPLTPLFGQRPEIQ